VQLVPVELLDLKVQQDHQADQLEPQVQVVQQDYEVQQDLTAQQAQQAQKATMDPQV
jgi:hypothetical protein